MLYVLFYRSHFQLLSFIMYSLMLAATFKALFKNSPIGGEMSTDYAANSPEFFFHHGFLDNIWWRWQKKSVKCKYAHFGKTSQKLINSRFATNDFMDSSYQGECVKVKYDDFLAKVLKPETKLGEYELVVQIFLSKNEAV